jgi:hypothetical protein
MTEQTKEEFVTVYAYNGCYIMKNEFSDIPIVKRKSRNDKKKPTRAVKNLRNV